MVETAEFRISEENAAEFLPKDCGTPLGSLGVPSVRKVTARVGSSLYKRIGELDQTFGGRFFYGWNVTRTYSNGELARAAIFHMWISAVFEPSGEELGTVYRDSEGCPLCGGGSAQLNDLRLDLRTVPKKKDIACTIAEECVVSERLADLLDKERITGYELRPVMQKPFFKDAPLALKRVPTGRVLLERAEALGLEWVSTEFWQWLCEPEQRVLLDQAEAENLERVKRRYRSSRPPARWFQLVVTAPRVPLVLPTRLGIHPFDEDIEGKNRCLYAGQKDHVAGLNRLSEVSIARPSWDESDITCTEQLVGTRRGYLRPRPLILISPRFRRLLIAHKVNGFRDEVAYLR